MDNTTSQPGYFFDEEGRTWLHSVASLPGQPPHFDQWYDWRGVQVDTPNVRLTPVGRFRPRRRYKTPEALRDTATKVEAGEGLLKRADLDAATVSALRGAAAEIEFLHTWHGLMELLDEHWPSDVFPFYEDAADRDKGPRIVSLIRALNAAKVDREYLEKRLRNAAR